MSILINLTTPSLDQLTTGTISLEESADLDSTAVDCLMDLRKSLNRLGETFILARVKTTVRDLLTNCDPRGLGAKERVFWSVADAADFAIQRSISSIGG